MQPSLSNQCTDSGTTRDLGLDRDGGLISVSSLAPEAPEIDVTRQTYGLGASYLLQAARLVAEAVDRDLIKAVLILAISRANVSAITENPVATTRYAGLTSIPPDSMRLPISVSALAREMRLPFETVRRHVAALKQAGLCVGVAGGVIIPGLALANPTYLMAIDQNWSLTRDFVDELGRLGVVATEQADALGVDIRRHTVRISVDYFIEGLRLLSRMAEVDLLDALILCAMSVASLQQTAQAPAPGGTSEDRVQVIPYQRAQPVRVSALAAHLLLPYETARRRTSKLVDQGLVERRPGDGFLVTFPIASMPRMAAGLKEFTTLTEDLLARLAKIGVTRR